MLSAGFDLIEVERIRRSIRNPRFLERVFSEAERQECGGVGRSVQSFAAAFAAKEAFSKALGTGIRGFSLRDVELLHDELGAPFLRLNGRARHIAEQKGLQFSVSLTHTRELAGAVVIAFRRKPSENGGPRLFQKKGSIYEDFYQCSNQTGGGAGVPSGDEPSAPDGKCGQRRGQDYPQQGDSRAKGCGGLRKGQ